MPLMEWSSWRFLLEGARVTLEVTGLAFLVGTVIGIVAGVASLSGRRTLRSATRAYVEVFRGASAIVLLFWAAFALPQLFGFNVSRFTAAVIALGTNMGAYCGELARGAIQAVPKGQAEASIAINLNAYQRMRHVVLPQALVSMLPPYGNLLIEVLKASALVALVGLDDIMRHANILRTNRIDSTFDIYVSALIIYFVLAGLITVVVRLAENHFSRGMDVGRAAGAAR